MKEKRAEEKTAKHQSELFEDRIHDKYENGDYDYIANSASATECTGLIARGAVDEAELESYADIYMYPPPLLCADEEPAK